MISKDKTYRTRDGRQVRIYADDGHGHFPIHGAVATRGEADRWVSRCWRKNGQANISNQSKNDLVEVKPRHKRTVWLNVYDNEVIHGGWQTKDDAEQYRHKNNCIACIKIDLDFEEGEGL